MTTKRLIVLTKIRTSAAWDCITIQEVKCELWNQTFSLKHAAACCFNVVVSRADAQHIMPYSKIVINSIPALCILLFFCLENTLTQSGWWQWFRQKKSALNWTLKKQQRTKSHAKFPLAPNFPIGKTGANVQSRYSLPLLFSDKRHNNETTFNAAL